MSKKRKRRRNRTPRRRPSVPTKFRRGTQVRVRRGVTDPGYADIPIGGWSGTIREVDSFSLPFRHFGEAGLVQTKELAKAMQQQLAQAAKDQAQASVAARVRFEADAGSGRTT